MSEGGNGGNPVRIVRLVDLEASGVDLDVSGMGAEAVEAGIRRIFRDTAARWPDDPAAARAFQDLWLDQYIRHERELVWLAMSASAPATVAGYLVGCRIDPAQSSRFASLGYFKTFAALTAIYPAHLHVNVDATHRNQHIGARLIEAFCAQLQSESIGGVHVVTGRTQRNVPFYERLGFRERAAAQRNGTEVLFLARGLAP